MDQEVRRGVRTWECVHRVCSCVCVAFVTPIEQRHRRGDTQRTIWSCLPPHKHQLRGEDVLTVRELEHRPSWAGTPSMPLW